MRNILLTCIAVFSCITAFGQTITGTVSDVSGTPLPGVSIVVDGTSRGTTTDFDGNYSINASQGDNLVFSYLGMKSITLAVGSQTVLNVTMEEDAEQLGEVVVTAFGIAQEKKSLGYAVQTIDAESITETKQPNLVSSLQGQVAGVQITNSGGAPGQSARIVIRGVNSLNPNANNQPLFVVDGVPIDNCTVESPNTPRGLATRVSYLTPADLESMSIFKGAAATALYGVRAANGAVIITTEKGRAGRTSTNFNTSVGFETLNRMPKLQDR